MNEHIVCGAQTRMIAIPSGRKTWTESATKRTTNKPQVNVRAKMLKSAICSLHYYVTTQ